MLTVKINKYYLTLSALLQELFLDKFKICDLIIDKGGTIAFIKAHRMEIKIIKEALAMNNTIIKGEKNNVRIKQNVGGEQSFASRCPP